MVATNFQSLVSVLDIRATAASSNSKPPLYEMAALNGDRSMSTGHNGKKLDWLAFRGMYFAHAYGLTALLQAYHDYGKYYEHEGNSLRVIAEILHQLTPNEHYWL